MWWEIEVHRTKLKIACMKKVYNKYIQIISEDIELLDEFLKIH